MDHTSFRFILPGGFWLKGECHRKAVLRPLTGNDEAFLLDVGETLLPAQKTTHLLERCLIRLGPLSPVTVEAVLSLTVGDREALLLHLRHLTMGSRLQCVLNCPDPDCGEKMDLELKVGELLLPPYQNPQQRYETTIKENGDAYRVSFRLPNGGDHEETAALALKNPQVAADALLHRCVEQVISNDNGDPIEEWPSAVAQQLPPLMAELDAQAELILNLTCPVCGHAFSSTLDTATYFFRELAYRMRHFYREVHLLAFYYHWSEAEILNMTSGKRQRYLENIRETLKE